MRIHRGGSPASKVLLRSVADLLVLAEPLQLRLWESAGVTVAQLRVLRVLADQAVPLPAGRLAGLAGMPQASLSRLLAKLEERDLVRRAVDPADRRRVEVELTAGGRSLLEASRLWRGTDFERAAEALSPAQREDLARALGAFTDRLRLLARGAAGPSGDAEPRAAGGGRR